MNGLLKKVFFLCAAGFFAAAVIGMLAGSTGSWVEVVEELGWISFVLLIVVTYLVDERPLEERAANVIPERMGWSFAAVAIACQVAAIIAGLVSDSRDYWVEGIEVAGSFCTLLLVLVAVTIHGGRVNK